MAIYHFSASMVSRSKGHSVVQVAASRSGTRLFDERTGRTKRPVRQDTPVASAILLADNAPSRWSDRSVLWNEVEAREMRLDSALAREIQVALPAELPLQADVTLAQTYAEEVFVKSGMIVDLNVWLASADEEPLRPWASLLVTTRNVTQEGFGFKVRAWNDRAKLISWRGQWSEICNAGLAAHGFPATLDHRSNFARGIDLEPQNKVGAAARRRSRAGEVMERVVEHQEIAKRNLERKRDIRDGAQG